jgi:hypothetical protein
MYHVYQNNSTRTYGKYWPYVVMGEEQPQWGMPVAVMPIPDSVMKHYSKEVTHAPRFGKPSKRLMGIARMVRRWKSV